MLKTVKIFDRIFNVSLERASQFSLIGLFILGLVYALYFATAILLPIFLAALLSIVLRPIVRAGRKIHIPESLSAFVVIVFLITLLVAGFNRLVEPASGWIERAPEAMQDVRRNFGTITQTLETAQNASNELETLANDANAPIEDTVVIRGPSLIERSMSYTWRGITQLVLTFTLLYFFLATGPSTLDGILKLFPVERQRQYFRDLLAAVQQQLTTYLRALAVIYLCLGILTGAAMYALDMPNPMLWGLMAFILGFVPYVGPAITTFVIAMVAIVSFDAPVDIVMPVLAYGFLTIMEGIFITPNVLGRRLTMSPFAILLSIVFWSWIWGFAGTVLAVPILASLKIIIDHAVGLRSVEEAAAKPVATEKADAKPIDPADTIQG